MGRAKHYFKIWKRDTERATTKKEELKIKEIELGSQNKIFVINDDPSFKAHLKKQEKEIDFGHFDEVKNAIKRVFQEEVKEIFLDCINEPNLRQREKLYERKFIEFNLKLLNSAGINLEEKLKNAELAELLENGSWSKGLETSRSKLKESSRSRGRSELSKSSLGKSRMSVMKRGSVLKVPGLKARKSVMKGRASVMKRGSVLLKPRKSRIGRGSIVK